MSRLLPAVVLCVSCATPQTVAPPAATTPPPVAPAKAECPAKLPAWSAKAPPVGAVVEKVCLLGASEDAWLRMHELVVPREGSPLSLDAVQADIEGLFAFGTVKDVVAVAEPVAGSGHVVLTYAVTRYALVTEVKLEGAKELTQEDVERLASIGLPASPVVERVVAHQLTEAYAARGYTRARVDAHVRPAGDGRAVLALTVAEGPRLTVTAIAFEGAKQVSVADLKRAIESKAGEPWSEAGVTTDASRLTALYYDRGMVNASVEAGEPREAKGPEGSVELVFRIKEGDVFRVGKLAVKGDALGAEKDVLKGLKTKPGAVFSRSGLQGDIERMKRLALQKGVEVEITPVTSVDTEKKTISLTFELEKKPGGSLKF